MQFKHTTHSEQHALTEYLYLVIDIAQENTQKWYGRVQLVHTDGSKITLWSFERPHYEALHAAMDAVRAQVAHKYTLLSGTVVTAMETVDHA